jgi:hypothetical protein
LGKVDINGVVIACCGRCYLVASTGSRFVLYVEFEASKVFASKCVKDGVGSSGRVEIDDGDVWKSKNTKYRDIL